MWKCDRKSTRTVYAQNCRSRSIILIINTVIVCWCISLTNCQRRIVNGTLSIGEPKYLAYFVKSPKSLKDYSGWVCGGAIIHPLYILTSAACLDDVKYVYAIVGYNKYIRAEDIEKNECTKRIKKKVVARSYQKDVNEKKQRWDYRDISVAKVESPYDFRDPVYVTYCSYAPAMVRVNFNNNFEEPGTQAVTFGWGHKKYYRMVGDTSDYNEEYVNYASTVVIDKELCKKQLVGHEEIKLNVNSYLLCTSGSGSLDDSGKLTDVPNMNDTKRCVKKRSSKDLEREPNLKNTVQPRADNKTSEVLNFYISNNNIRKSFNNQLDYRRHGPCQNDHGGPLVTWIGGREYVIGVACGFQVNKNMECVGPYLYTSTYSSGEFIFCMLRFSRRSRLCSMLPQQKGYRIVEEDLIW